MTKKTDNGLSDKQALFAREYIKDNNATRAAIDAGYSPRTARAQGNQLMNVVKVKEVIDKLREERSERTSIDADYVLVQLADIQQAKITEIFNDNGGLRDVSEWPDVWQRMVVGIDVFEEYEGSGQNRTFVGYTKKVKLMDRTAILKMLGQHVNVKAFSESIDVNVNNSIGERMLKARRRIANSE